MSHTSIRISTCLLPVSLAALLVSACLHHESAPSNNAAMATSPAPESICDGGYGRTDGSGKRGNGHTAPLKVLKGGASGVSLLMEGARQGNATLVRTQLADGVRVNAIDRKGETALSHAIRHEQHEIALLLISEGANVNIRDAQGNTPLNSLCLAPSHYPLQRDSAEGGNYALDDSFYEGRRKVFRALLSARADTNMRDAEGVTPLMRALWCSWQPSVDVLVVDAGANTRAVVAHTFQPDEMQRWPGLAAQSLGTPRRAKSGVVDTTASLKGMPAAGDGYESLRFTAVYRTEEDMIRRLIAAGADPNGRNAADCKVAMGPAGATPLVAAASVGDSTVVELLLKAKADVNARDAEGRTALMHAAMRGDGSMSRTLLSAGADRSLKDNSGRTAAQYARDKGYSSLSKMLENPSAYRRFINMISSLFD